MRKQTFFVTKMVQSTIIIGLTILVLGNFTAVWQNITENLVAHFFRSMATGLSKLSNAENL